MRVSRLSILLRKTYGKILLALTPMLSKGKRIYGKIPKATEKQTLIKILVTLNIAILLLSVAILALMLGLPHSSPGTIYQTPISGNTTKPTNSTNSNNSLPNQQESPSGSGSHIKVEPSPSNNSSQQQPASILKLGVYDGYPFGNPSDNLSTIDWSLGGPILPGQSRDSSVVYFRNEGNVPVTLYLSNQTWSFKDYKGDNLPQDFQRYFSLTWDSEGSALQVNQVRAAVFTLTVSSNITDVVSFSFDIVVTLSY